MMNIANIRNLSDTEFLNYVENLLMGDEMSEELFRRLSNIYNYDDIIEERDDAQTLAHELDEINTEVFESLEVIEQDLKDVFDKLEKCGSAKLNSEYRDIVNTIEEIKSDVNILVCKKPEIDLAA